MIHGLDVQHVLCNFDQTGIPIRLFSLEIDVFANNQSRVLDCTSVIVVPHEHPDHLHKSNQGFSSLIVINILVKVIN